MPLRWLQVAAVNEVHRSSRLRITWLLMCSPARVINSIWHERVHLVATPGLLLFGLAFSTGLGIVGGLYPALWAMRLMPMDAIRRG